MTWEFWIFWKTSKTEVFFFINILPTWTVRLTSACVIGSFVSYIIIIISCKFNHRRYRNANNTVQPSKKKPTFWLTRFLHEAADGLLFSIRIQPRFCYLFYFHGRSCYYLRLRYTRIVCDAHAWAIKKNCAARRGDLWFFSISNLKGESFLLFFL